MSQIEVPDWVVEAAMRAEDKFYAEKNYGSFSDIQGDDAAAAMLAALTAALGAWAVPVPQYYGAAHGGWIDCDSAEQLEKMRMAGHHRVRTLYDLRQEKPE